ncbi:MAG: glycosyltransferase, partial [Candidatus Latescibacteria bacterium]|nr:glycosyltransferase [Candidatus Latescibacterota bacterium]
MTWWQTGLLAIYTLSLGLLMVVSLHRHIMVRLYFKYGDRVPKLTERFETLPYVTVQLPVYNEMYVVERLIQAVSEIDYPRDRFEIQVLDDSSDETTAISTRCIEALQQDGLDIVLIRRSDRVGYKAGALAEGLRLAKGELVAIFDADFVPQKDFLHKTVHHFTSANVGLVQARWSHLNRDYSLLTKVQAIYLDGHFVMEHGARSRAGLFFNFNGTAGVWRKSCIVAVGGWQHDTLTEDLDLSYRAQLAGWQFIYLQDVVTPAEVPVEVNAWKTQQFRWAKGSVQTLIKLFPRLMASKVSVFKKIQAIFHMGGYLVHPMMLTLVLLALPVLRAIPEYRSAGLLFGILAIPLCFSVIAPSTLYLVSQRVAHDNWKRRSLMLPFLIVVGVGMALSNTRAIAEAIMRK